MQQQRSNRDAPIGSMRWTDILPSTSSPSFIHIPRVHHFFLHTLWSRSSSVARFGITSCHLRHPNRLQALCLLSSVARTDYSFGGLRIGLSLIGLELDRVPMGVALLLPPPGDPTLTSRIKSSYITHALTHLLDLQQLDLVPTLLYPHTQVSSLDHCLDSS
jgi:hypothetical protein